ncbi:MAG: glycosyltransferase [Candidatus Ozemobacteraceae bacterium]
MSLVFSSLYAAFDIYPAAKGAAVHIREAAGALFEYRTPGLLLVLGTPEMPCRQCEPSGEIRRFFADEPNFLQRAMQFGNFVAKNVEETRNSLSIAQFRDPWSGIPLLACPHKTFRTIYEVNGLPSIELPSFYPNLSPRTLEKIRAEELLCLHEADQIVCPSENIRKCLTRLGILESKISVIPNGAGEIWTKSSLPASEAPRHYLIYFGALQSWQGLETLLRAFSLLADLEDLVLVLCVSGSKPRMKALKHLADRLGISHRLLWFAGLSQEELQPWVRNAQLSVAPLADVPRNRIQGCCPMKIIESLAAGVPVVASDLPVVRELMEDGIHGRLVRPDRPSDLARAIRILLEHPETCSSMGNAGKKRVQEAFTWTKAKSSLHRIFKELVEPTSDNTSS